MTAGSQAGSDDIAHMRAALSLGARGLGTTWPNPSVGCVIVRDGLVVGRGWTARGGRPHAETRALEQAGEAARGATVYVTLEPCANWGRTPPCAKALIDAGVARVVVATLDPDPRVDGRGIAWLREAGVEVETGTLDDEARAQHVGLYRRILDHRPMVSLKLAQSLDGRIAASTGHSQWITSEPARAEAHRLRATHDAILVGSGTAVIDDPTLTCRLPGLEKASPVRIVLDRRLRLSPESRLAKSVDEAPVWVFTSSGLENERAERAAALRTVGVEVIDMPDPSIDAVLTHLAARSITRLLIEGGSTVAASFLAADRVDRLHVATAPMVIGGDGLPSIAELGLERVDEAQRWKRIESRAIGVDRLDVLERRERG
ncbi:MAG: bifunctional diaminohydroxyphosphoribosylaminopyrimidine deaminase/5-amino-6-(5-phosphoribosylamino)uracil reductase RibD [Geminicoccaceae bacterium]